MNARNASWFTRESPDSAESMFVITSRARLARNISGMVFPDRFSKQDWLSFRACVGKVLINQGFEDFASCFDAHPQTDKANLLLITDHNVRVQSAVFGNLEAGTFVILGDEDHIRCGAIHLGLHLEHVIDTANAIALDVERVYPYCYDADRYGFLTASLANAGTAIRLSVWMHIPGLWITGKWDAVATTLEAMDVSIRGILGEFSEITSGFVQISNRTSFGRTQDEIFLRIKSVVHFISDAERLARSQLLTDYPELTTQELRLIQRLDATYLTLSELMESVSAASLGSGLGLNIRMSNRMVARVLMTAFMDADEFGRVPMRGVRSLMSS